MQELLKRSEEVQEEIRSCLNSARRFLIKTALDAVNLEKEDNQVFWANIKKYVFSPLALCSDEYGPDYHDLVSAHEALIAVIKKYPVLANSNEELEIS